MQVDYYFVVAIMEPQLDKQGCNETVCDEAEYIGAGELPSRDLPFDWMPDRIDWATVKCCVYCFDCISLQMRCCSRLPCCILSLWAIQIPFYSISAVAM